MTRTYTFITFSLMIAVLSCLSAGISRSALAQTMMPTPSQIAKLKAMSPAQQKALAQSVGIEIPDHATSNTQPKLSEEPFSTNHNSQPEKKESEKDADELDDEQKEDNRISGNQALPFFGHNLFKRGPNSFKPSSAIPVPANYILGPGDNIVIQLYGKENNTYPLIINREGQIQFPDIGPINLAGLTFSEAKDVINDIVSKQMIGIKNSMTMGALRSIRIFVLGEVTKPGSFTISSLSNMTNALFASGGITKVGSLRDIQLKRQGKVVSRLDLYDLLLQGDTSSDARLLPGDVIFVPPLKNAVQIEGQVARPAIYELRGSATAMDLVALAGGATRDAYLPDSSLTRINSLGERSFIDLDLSTQSGKRMRIQNGDQIRVGRILEFVHDQITLRGSFKRPGLYSWRRAMHFSDIVQSPLDFMPGSDLRVGLIQTMSIETGKIQAKLFSPEKAWQHPHTDHDPLLQSYDEIYAFDMLADRSTLLKGLVDMMKSQAHYKEQEKTVHISGSVRFPGMYPLTHNMMSQELVLLAGGLSESALGTTGEITRYEISNDLERVVMHLSVDLSSEGRSLHAGDTLQIKQIPLWKQKESVTIKGEVMFPGTYSILPGESLMDVLTRAGGITPHAYPLGAVFSRAYLRQLEEERLEELKQKLENDIAIESTDEKVGKKPVDISEADQLLKKLDNTSPLGRMVIDLERVLKNPVEHDFQLEDGDALTIPRFKPSVTVIGEVQYPTSHFYDRRLSTNDYIKRSGGTNKNADKRRIYIVKANGAVTEPTHSAWFKARREIIEPGDTVVVPLDTNRVDSLEVWAKATTIMYNAALGAAAIGGL